MEENMAAAQNAQIVRAPQRTSSNSSEAPTSPSSQSVGQSSAELHPQRSRTERPMDRQRRLPRRWFGQAVRRLGFPTPREQAMTLFSVQHPSQPWRGGGPEAVTCTICLADLEEGQETRTLVCSHAFHTGCVDTWLQEAANFTCPTCRAPAGLGEHFMNVLEPNSSHTPAFMQGG